jgi:hypothetical protein
MSKNVGRHLRIVGVLAWLGSGVMAVAGVFDWNTAAFVAVSAALPWSTYEIIGKARGSDESR